MADQLTASAERAVSLALRAGRYRTRAETAEAILADLVAAYRHECRNADDCQLPDGPRHPIHGGKPMSRPPVKIDPSKMVCAECGRQHDGFVCHPVILVIDLVLVAVFGLVVAAMVLFA